MTSWARPSPPLIRHPDDVPGLKGRWTTARDRADFFCPDYHDYAATVPGQGDGRQVVAVGSARCGSDLLLPFVRDRDTHAFSIGERRLGGLDVATLRLVNPWLAEGLDPQDIAALLADVVTGGRADLVDLGEIRETAALRQALDLLSWPALPLRLGRKKSVRWLIDLPDSFDSYLAGFPRKERRNLAWKLRRIDKDFDMRVETFCTAEGIERFLTEGERISRMSYQWTVGQQLRNDRPTRDWYRNLAEQGRLRCHLLLLDGVPCAFSRGVISGGVYLDDTPGYDPSYARYSAGTVLMLHVLKDLIENTPCRVFDFGRGGDWSGYKARFGTRGIPCNAYYVLDARKPRALAILAGETLLSAAKNAGMRLLRDEALKDRIKRRLRRYGS